MQILSHYAKYISVLLLLISTGAAVGLLLTHQTPLAMLAAAQLFLLAALTVGLLRAYLHKPPGLISEAFYQTMLAAANEGIWVIDAEGRTTYANQPMAHIMGLPLDEINTKTIYDLMPAEIHEGIQVQMAQRRQGVRNRVDFPFTQPDGTQHWTIASVSPIFDDRQQFTGAVALFTDITERRKTLEELSFLESQMRLVLDNSPIIMFALDKKGIVTFSDGQALQELGLKPGELIGQSVFDVFADVPDGLRLMQEALAGEDIYQEITFYNLTFLLVFRPIYNEANQVIGVSGIALDVTKQQTTLAALQLSEERYKTIVQNVDDIIYARNKKGQFAELNPAFEQVLGWPVEEWLGKSFVTLNHPDDPMITSMLERAREGQTISQVEVRVLAKSGVYMLLEITEKPLYQDGIIVGSLGIARDITERKKLEINTLELARERERLSMITHFMHNFSHDIRTPLSIIGTNTYLARRKLDTERHDEVGQHFAQIETHLEKLRLHLDELFSMETLGPALDADSFEPCLLQFILESVVEEQPQGMMAKQHHLRLETPEEDLYTLGNPEYLMRAMRHLLVNVINYTDDEGNITIKLKRQDEHLVITFSDDGIGIPRQSLSRVFEPFYRVDNARSHNTGGMGLGLNIVQIIINAHHGNISVKSELGQGTTFTVMLPAHHKVLRPIVIDDD